MKLKVFFVVTIAVLALMGGQALAIVGPYYIWIDDISDGSPVVTTNISFLQIQTGYEYATIIYPHPNAPDYGPPPNMKVNFTEPQSDPYGPRVSDYLTTGTVDSSFQIFFASDGYPNFSPPTNPTATLQETGDWQIVYSYPNLPGAINIFELKVRSDLNTSEVPEPSTLLLLGAGLAGLGILRSRFKK